MIRVSAGLRPWHRRPGLPRQPAQAGRSRQYDCRREGAGGSDLSRRMSAERRVLHLVICAAGPASVADHLCSAARALDRDVYAIPTPERDDFVDVHQLATATGHDVCARWRRPGEPGSLKTADAVIVAPATYNTI